MPFRTYVFRLRQEADLLTEDEWADIAPYLENRIPNIRAYMKETGCTIAEASKREPSGQAALDRYQALTGMRPAHPDHLFALRMRDYGALCPDCARPFRTPRARLCAECGYELPVDRQAGPLAPPHL